MRHGYLRRISVLAALAATVALSPELSAGQAPTPGARKAAAVGRDTARPTPQPNQWHVAHVGRAVSQGRCHTRDTNALLCQKNELQRVSVTMARTPWGYPDLQDRWTNTTTTPLERPGDLAGKQVLTPEERAARDAARAGGGERQPRAGDTGSYNQFWGEAGTASAQTSLIVDPADGKLPGLTPGAQKRADAIEARRRLPPASWEDLNAYDRCITRGLPGAMMPGFYNHNYQIAQGPGYVAIFVEMIHDIRIIPIDGRPHLGPGIRQWMGDSRGRWDGQTLVVETTNFNDKINEVTGNAMRLPSGEPLGGRYHAVFGTSGLKLVERFTRVDADTVDYRFTVTDPATFTTTWTAATPMMRVKEPIFEYACHEGNYAVPHMLSGARAQEQGQAQKKSGPQ